MTSASSASSSARSFSVLLEAEQKGPRRPGIAKSPEAGVKALRRELGSTLRGIKNPSGAVIFVSGAAGMLPDLARAVAEEAPQITGLVVPATGVLDESSEIEGSAAVSGVVWASGSAKLEVGDAVFEPTRATRLLFGTREALSPQRLSSANAGCLFGAGCEGEAIWGVEKGRVESSALASLVLMGQGAPVVETSSACRVVGESFAVTDIDGSAVLELDGRPALEVLSSTVGGGRHAGLILVALEVPGSTARLFRSLRGIDPGRKAIVIDAPISRGDRLSFAARDPVHAKADLAEAARRAEQQALGSAPRFAIYLSCAARGRALYREPDVDVKILRKRFAKLPIAGMHAAFELVPCSKDEKPKDGEAPAGDPTGARIQLMTGLFALFRAPS